ncbi:TetR family transcriptional regulator [Oceanococcus atlanticus]|uniref:TetR family transcriptional regulator n=1 Tax=Oceanococcus atlanticus TaxID=1317117 RepID=A0A1Y1SF34_9GAMM|nr:TetR/AcrR family transcriptional regulator [Oceanococcus atlanticus]ORE87314.1 TetR family transcriptional regulator [Oceanococcus atlanticus]
MVRKSPAAISPAIQARIEAAVLATFSEQEFHKVSLIEIARQANVSLQTIYKYYGSKEALLFGTLDTHLGALAGRLIDHLEGIENYEDRMRKVFWVILDYFESNPRVGRILASSVYLNTWSRNDTFRQPELFAVFTRVLREGRDKGILTDEVDERVLLDLLLGFASRAITMWVLRGQPAGLRDQANPMFRLLWRAMRKPDM